ncbi:MAG TPA: DUF3788 family protein [Bacillus bacterium]|nr:DUF3788 family protein [Bacillus sp. (in: firmicutes)]
MTVQFLTNHKNDDNYIGEKLEQLFEQSEVEIFIVAPYISMNSLIKKMSDFRVGKIRVLTRLSLHDFLTNASDLDAIYNLLELNHVEIRYFSNLHAKVYLFDNKQAVITSANFTPNGLFHNLEYGVLVKDGIEQISQDLSSLWDRAGIVDQQLLLNIENELLTVGAKKEVASTVKKELDTANKKIINPKMSHQLQSKVNAINETEILDEIEALNIVIKQCNLSEKNAEKIRIVYEMIKRNIPEEVREQCAFRYSLNNNKANIACNIMNYRLFLLPYTKENLVQLIYPSEEVENLVSILPEERRGNSEEWIFKSFNCEILRFTMDEILNLNDNQWQSFKNACLMAFYGKRSRVRENNIQVNWTIEEERYFYIHAARGAKAKGIIMDNGFLVLKGSMAAIEIAPSFPKTQYYDSRQQLIMDKVPTSEDLIALIGKPLFEVWTALCGMIEQKYDMEHLWNNGGKAWEYEYKYRRCGKTLCALYAKENCFGFMVILGKHERTKFETDKQNYSLEVQKVYDETKTYHDGKWMMFELIDTSLFADMEKLLLIKRRPNKK